MKNIIQNVLNILDGFGDSEVGRLKLKMDEKVESGEYKYVYHHGRGDIGSPALRCLVLLSVSWCGASAKKRMKPT